MSVKVNMRVPLGLPMPRLVDFIKRGEDAGLHGIGIHDHSETGRDVFAALTLAASRTSRLVIYPAVTNGITRHPIVLASLANSLEEIAPGRILMTIGTGDLIIRRIGLRRGNIELLRQTAITVRELLAGRGVAFGPNPSESLVYRSHPPTPVYVACAGPRGAEMAGEVADGVLIMAGLDARVAAAVRAHIAVGAKRAGRDPATIPIIWLSQFHLGADLPSARDWARAWFHEAGVPAKNPAVRGVARTPKAYVDWFREAGIPLPEDAAKIPDSAIDAIGVFGPPEYCAERLLRAKEEAGIDHVHLAGSHIEDPGETVPGMYRIPKPEMTALECIILPRLRG